MVLIKHSVCYSFLRYKYTILGENFIPSNTLLSDVKEMFTIFCNVNPEKSIVKKVGLTKGFAQIFQRKYAYDFEILLFIAKGFIVTRKNAINLEAKMKKMSLRAARKTAEKKVANC